MKVAHWTAFNRSGMNRVAESIHKAELEAGIESLLCNPHENPGKSFDEALDADVHVSHTFFPDWIRRKIKRKYKLIYVAHGTPEHVFHYAVEEGLKGGYGHGDPWMLVQYYLQHSDAVVTFWPRHQAIWQSMCDKATQVHCIPLGVDKTFWKPGQSRGKYAGAPSLFTAENCHQIKWPLDLFITWPWVYPRVQPGPVLHAVYLPFDQHRWFFPLVNRNGCSYGSFITHGSFQHEDLRNVFRSVDYYIGLVRYGDFNRVCLEANACGTRTISYAGNPYSDFWIPEGDQRVMADELVKILNGQVKPRAKLAVPSIKQTSRQLIKIYETC